MRRKKRWKRNRDQNQYHLPLHPKSTSTTSTLLTHIIPILIFIQRRTPFPRLLTRMRPRKSQSPLRTASHQLVSTRRTARMLEEIPIRHSAFQSSIVSLSQLKQLEICQYERFRFGYIV
jgi:hypothetical protein